MFFRAMSVAVLAALSDTVAASMKANKIKMFSDKNVNLDRLVRATEHQMSKSARSIYKAEVKSKGLRAYHKYRLSQAREEGQDEP